MDDKTLAKWLREELPLQTDGYLEHTEGWDLVVIAKRNRDALAALLALLREAEGVLDLLPIPAYEVTTLNALGGSLQARLRTILGSGYPGCVDPVEGQFPPIEGVLGDAHE